jgi:hypothetical protein
MNDSTNSSEISALKGQLFTLLVALIVVSGTVTVYLFRQASLEGKAITASKPQAEQLIKVFNQNQAVVQDFVKQVAVYGQTHPDFRPVLAKNGIVLSTNAPAK